MVATIGASNRIDVHTDHVRQYTLFLNEDLVDMSRTVTVVTDGAVSYEGTVTPSLETLLRQMRLQAGFPSALSHLPHHSRAKAAFMNAQWLRSPRSGLMVLPIMIGLRSGLHSSPTQSVPCALPPQRCRGDLPRRPGRGTMVLQVAARSSPTTPPRTRSGRSEPRCRKRSMPISSIIPLWQLPS